MIEMDKDNGQEAPPNHFQSRESLNEESFETSLDKSNSLKKRGISIKDNASKSMKLTAVGQSAKKGMRNGE